MQEQTEPTSPYESLKQPRPLLVILSGPSGVGKDTVMAGLRQLTGCCRAHRSPSEMRICRTL